MKFWNLQDMVRSPLAPAGLEADIYGHLARREVFCEAVCGALLQLAAAMPPSFAEGLHLVRGTDGNRLTRIYLREPERDEWAKLESLCYFEEADGDPVVNFASWH